MHLQEGMLARQQRQHPPWHRLPTEFNRLNFRLRKQALARSPKPRDPPALQNSGGGKGPPQCRGGGSGSRPAASPRTRPQLPGGSAGPSKPSPRGLTGWAVSMPGGYQWPHGPRLPGRMAWRLLVLFPFLLVAVSGNTAPFFNMSIVYVPEDLEIGQEAFQLQASDVDGDPLTYSISGPEAFYFSVVAQTGKVLLKNLLDRESQARLTLTITVSDGQNDAVSRKLTVIVEDRNDNAPVFQDLPYETTVAENATAGSIIYTVSATDSDTGNASKISYSIEEVIPDNMKNHWLFYILPNGNVVLNGSLDYALNTFYQIKILAKDGGGLLHGVLTFQQSVTYLSVTIRDLPNLDPYFLNEPYSGSVPENCPLGTSVLTVTATDRDTGVKDEISYSITDASVPFAINATTGTITVTAPLDREQLPNEELLLEVMAWEKNLDIYGNVAKISTQVTVTVADVNDNKPQFYLCSLSSCNFSANAQSNFTGSIVEHSSSNLAVSGLSIVTHDPDKGVNSSFELYLQGPNASAFFVSPKKIVGTGEVQILVQDPLSVDYEISHVMVVQIVANDTGNPTDCCSTATVTINLIDSNDHIPEFPQSVYNLNVVENSVAGTVISPGITAYDPDSGILGQITYQLFPESVREVFTVNATSGAVLVYNGSWLDRETRSFYYANLQAKDGGNLTGSTLLEITVLDANDNPPIVTGSYFISVNEGQNVSVQIQALDNDEPGTPNSELHFEILPGPFSANFTIDAVTGEMHNKGPLDREALDDDRGRMVVTVEVHDLGTPQLNTSVNVTITVGDVNDNAPVFLNQSYEYSVFEGSAESFVGNVEATDADRTDINSRISFLLQSGSGSNNFLIRSSRLGPGHYSGQLSLDPDVSLDYDSLQQKFFSLVVLAENTAADSVGDTANASVVVYVLDVNDEPPTILPTSLHDVSVSENGTQEGLVCTVVGSDPDTNHSLVFEKLAVTCFKGLSSAGEVCWDWFVLAPNGSVLVNSSDIDYELCDVVVLTLRAEDINTEKGNRYSQNETLRILITDVNDNAPVFLPSSETFVVVPDVSPVDLQVAVVKAKDADSGPRGTITFSILSVVFVQDNGISRPFENLFKVVTTAEQDTYVGSLQVASNLDGSLKGQYQVTVEAKDGEVPVHATQTVLDIFTVDNSYLVRLQFVIAVDEVQSNLDNIKLALTVATKAQVYVVAIRTQEDARTSPQAKSVMEAYFVYSNGTALEVNQLSVLLQSNSQVLTQLVNLGLAVIGPGEVTKPDKEKELTGVIAGLAAFLLLFILVMTLALVLTTRSFKRKLNAMKALKAATTLTPAMVQQGPGIPGTNQYNAEGANPVLNLSFDPAHDLGFHEDSCSVASMNSLDENTVNAPGDDTPKVSKGKAWHMNTASDEALVAALHLKEPSKVAFINNAFTTTDL
ncbi:cadherin-related family member 2 [Rhea pennata]|uniref:cadherin-related family member 2 n=1 Tax=Rhea pennata TaxID=8795 RepID=UPI002E25CCD4